MFCQQVDLLEPVRFGDDQIQKVLHVRADLFLVLSFYGLIQLRPLSPLSEPLCSFQVDLQEGQVTIMDIDFRTDETRILITFLEKNVALLNLVTNEYRQFATGSNPEPIAQTLNEE